MKYFITPEPQRMDPCEFWEYLQQFLPCEPTPTIQEPVPTPTEPITYEPPVMTQPTPIVGFEPVEQSIDKVYYYHSDHLGSSTYVTDINGRPIAYYDYLPFGEVMVEHNQTTNFNNGYKFNAKELDEATGMSYYGARYYDSRLSVFVSVDPLVDVTMMPYQYCSNNPINRIDPTGMVDHEYDKDGNKISNLGGDKVDFYHQEDGSTKIVDRESGASNIINNGESLIRGYTQRDNDTSWSTLFKEWDQGIGPTKSLFTDFDNSSAGVFGSFDKVFSIYAGKARTAVLSGGTDKGSVKFNYGDINPFTAGIDGWEQFIGRANLSYYKLGDKVLYMMNDSKSMTSFMYRMSPSWERSDFKLNGTTYQTYIWTETMQEVQQKNQIRADFIKQVQTATQEYRNTEHQRLPTIKW